MPIWEKKIWNQLIFKLKSKEWKNKPIKIDDKKIQKREEINERNKLRLVPKPKFISKKHYYYLQIPSKLNNIKNGESIN